MASPPPSRTPSSWDTKDDILLRHLKEQQKLGWKQIAAYFKNRTPNACQFRWRRLMSGSLKSSDSTSSIAATVAGSTASGSAHSQTMVGTGSSSPRSPSSKPSATVHRRSTISGKSSRVRRARSASGQSPTAVSPRRVISNNTGNDSQSLPTSGLAPKMNSTNIQLPSSASHSQPQGFGRYDYSFPNVMGNRLGVSLGQAQSHASGYFWSQEEDELLMTRNTRNLSFDEVSIILPSRTEQEIMNRIGYLDSLNSASIKPSLSNLCSNIHSQSRKDNVFPSLSMSAPASTFTLPQFPLPKLGTALNASFSSISSSSDNDGEYQSGITSPTSSVSSFSSNDLKNKIVTSEETKITPSLQNLLA